MSDGRLPAWARAVLGLLLRGRGAEHVRGDIEERYRSDLASTGTAGRAGARLRRQVLASCVAWWRPAAWSARRRGVDEGRTGRMGTRRNGWETVAQDVRVAVRGLRRRPLLALGVILTLGLGVGATTATFSVVDAVLLEPLAYDDADRLVAVGTTFPGREWRDERGSLQYLAGTSYLNFRDFRERARSFSTLAAVELTGLLLPDRGSGPELASAAHVTEDFWPTLAVGPAFGRLFDPEEHVTGDGVRPVILSHGAWERRFGGDPDVLGAPVEVVGLTMQVVGVLPRDFRPPEAVFYEPPEFWLPFQKDHPRYDARGRRSVFIVGRLAPSVSVADARAEMGTLAPRLAEEFPDGNVYPDGSRFGAGVNGLKAEIVGTSGRLLWVFLAASGLLLLIAVLNAAALLLARGLDRTDELGVRRALGAGVGRIVRLLLTESSLLAAAGGLLGVALGYAGVSAFHRFAPGSIPRMPEVAVDGRVLTAALVAVAITGLVTGLLPALRLARGAPRVRSGRRTVDSDRRVRGVLVVGQVGLAVVLLSGAGLLLHSFLELRAVEPGFRPEGLVTFSMGLKRPGAPEGESARQAWDALLGEVAAVPGVRAVAGASNTPFQSPNWAPRILLPGDPDDAWRDGVAGYVVTPGYLDVVGTRLVRGRGLEPTDGATGPFVALVNEAFVRTHLGGAEALGVTLRMPEGGDGADEPRPIRIVGVVENAVQERAEQGPRSAVYVPYTQADWTYSVHALVRSDRLPASVMPELRGAAARFNPVAPARGLTTMPDRMAATRTDPRFRALLIGTFAAVALLLSAAGLYATLAHSVGRRARELGIRMALGARRRSVLRAVLLQGLWTSGLGLLLGTTVAMLLGRVLSGFLFGVRPTDPATHASVAGLLLLVAGVACLVPARRATTVDPSRVLRSE